MGRLTSALPWAAQAWYRERYMIGRRLNLFLPVWMTTAAWAASAVVQEVSWRVPGQVRDALDPVEPHRVRVDGWLGQRIRVNIAHRLATVELDPLLAGYRHRPGHHPWIGEHIGKWMHAATLAWVHTGDPTLRRKLEEAVEELLRTQEPDGYLGTYVATQRFGLFPGADWDVWSHKYNLIGLLTYYRYTGHEPALEGCRKMADLLVSVFPGQKSILQAGTHVGMAATSVLEPMVWLYRLTGEPRYLAFCRYLVEAWEEPGGPRLLSSLLTSGRVHQTANAKAYEMLSNLVGLCELYRVTGESNHLRAVLAAWEDIVTRRLYITGSASQGEFFRGDYEWPNHEGAHVAETCVTVTWLQLNLQLLRLTGEMRFAREMERTLYNHLTAAQHPDGTRWCYFTPLEGRKAYGPGINCCVSSGPRGLALAPYLGYAVSRSSAGDALTVLTLETSRAELILNGQTVEVQQHSGFPTQGLSRLTLRLDRPARFGLRVRVPEWARPVEVRLPNRQVLREQRGDVVEIGDRLWQDGDQVDIRFALGLRLVRGTHGNAGRAAVLWGPFVLAHDVAWNLEAPSPAGLGWSEPVTGACRWRPDAPLRVETRSVVSRSGRKMTVGLIPFADAGAHGFVYRVWLWGPDAGWRDRVSVLLEGTESRSRPGNQPGSINDGDAESLVVTYDGQRAEEDWYAVTLPRAVRISRVVFRHGRNFHDGGWFDASAGKPRVEIRRRPADPWEPVGLLEDYPATTATSPADLRPGQPFELKLTRPVSAVAVRVVGRPASGDNPVQAFSSCGELEAFAQ